MKTVVSTWPTTGKLVICASIAAALAGCAGHSGLLFPWTSQTQDTKLEHVTTANFDERVLKCDKPVLVDFYAEWCGPCKQLTPAVEEFAAEHPEFRVVKVNVDDNRELVQKYSVARMPTLLAIRGGSVFARSEGLVSKKGLQDIMNSPTTTAKSGA